jgi:predicted ester cyclase
MPAGIRCAYGAHGGIDLVAPLCDGRANRLAWEGSAAVSAGENEAVVRRWIDAYNDRDKQAESDARAPGYVAHAPGMSGPLDAEAWVAFIDSFVEAFPDLRLSVESIVSDGDMVAARVAFQHQERLLTITRQEVHSHALKCLNPLGRTGGVCATPTVQTKRLA